MPGCDYDPDAAACVLAALASPLRLEMLRLLFKEDLDVKTLAQGLDLSIYALASDLAVAVARPVTRRHWRR